MSGRKVDDPFRRVDYRRMIAWPARIEREAPFLLSALSAAPERSVVDLGCGTGEHTDYLAAQGWRSVGIDRSAAQIEKANEYRGRRGACGPEFLHGDVARLGEHTSERFGGAIWLGNGLPYLEEPELEAALGELSRVLLPGGILVYQLLNYARIRRLGIRHLPLNFRDDPQREGGEIVFLRLMTVDGPRHIRFQPSSFSLRPGEDPPVEVKSASEVRVRTWRREELEEALEAAGFQVQAVHGDMTGGEYEEEESSDLVTVARLQA